MLLGYTQNHTGGTYLNFNICTNFILLSHDIIWLNKTCVEYVSRWKHTKDDSNIFQYEYEFGKRNHVKIDPVNTDNIKPGKNIKTEQGSGVGGEVKYIQKTIKIFYFKKQEKKGKQDHY